MDAKRLEKCRQRLHSRMPIVGGWLRRKAALALAREGSPQAMAALAEAIANDDHQVRSIASDALNRITDPRSIDAVCEVWAKTRYPALSALLKEREWIASNPPHVKVLTTLKFGRSGMITEIGAELVEPLLGACDDGDASIAQRARLSLRQLKRDEAKEAVCRLFLENGSQPALEAALEAKYLPRDEYQRALFFFLTEQWGRYENIDFDNRLLRAVYESANLALRQRITEKLRAAGRTDFLTVVVGSDFRARAGVMTPDEMRFLVRMLETNREWAKLWALAFELPFVWSARIVDALARNEWRPEIGDEQAVFEEMRGLISVEMMKAAEEVSFYVPPAVQRARARVRGRVNDVAFSPVSQVIAIGTGNRKVGLWNFQRGVMEKVLDGFGHSVGRVVFTPNGELLCGERTNSDDPCAIQCFKDGRSFTLAHHDGSVTAVEPVSESLALTAGRDYRVALWDTGSGHRVAEELFDIWGRGARVSFDGQRAALLHNGVTLLSLPHLKVEAKTRGWDWKGVARCAAFAPDGESLIVGKFNGEVVVCRNTGHQLTPEPNVLFHHNGQAQGVEVLRNRSVIITAGSDGTVQFISWTNRALLGSVQVAGERLTSLRVSPDGSFMVIGDTDASISLWDLRVLDVPEMFARPFARSVPVDLAAINAAAGNPDLHPRMRPALRYMGCVLRHRFRYDIEIDEVPDIQAGEFDIEIEE